MKLEAAVVDLLYETAATARARAVRELERELHPVHFERCGMDALRDFDIVTAVLIPPPRSWFAQLVDDVLQDGARA